MIKIKQTKYEFNAINYHNFFNNVSNHEEYGKENQSNQVCFLMLTFGLMTPVQLYCLYMSPLYILCSSIQYIQHNYNKYYYITLVIRSLRKRKKKLFLFLSYSNY